MRRSQAVLLPLATLFVCSFFHVAILAAQSTAAPGSSSASRPASKRDSQPAVKRAITEKDLFDFQWIGDPQLSPDGSRIAFVKVVVNEKRDGYETSLWMVPTAGSASPTRLTNGKHDTSPRWSPDGTKIAFVRGGAPVADGKPQPPQIAVLSLTGGEAWTVTDLPKGASGPEWSPDGKQLAFTSSTTSEDIARQVRMRSRGKKDGIDDSKTTAENERTEKNTAQARQPEPDSDHESDIHVITRAVYRFNGQGYLDPKRHSHIWVMDVPTTSDEVTTPTQLTSGNFDERQMQWTHDGQRIYFVTSRADEPYYELPTSDIDYVPAAGGAVQKVATVNMGVSDFALTRDDKRAAFHGETNQPVRSYTQPDLWVMDLAANAQPKNLTANYDFDMGSGVFGDNGAPRGGGRGGLIWSADGRTIYDVVGRQGRTILVRVDPESGAVTEITKGEQAVQDFGVSDDGRTIAALISTPTMIGDLFTVAADGTQRRLTDINQKLWSQLHLTEPEEINYTSFDGKKIQAWAQKPPDFDPKKKYPLILDIHGGPHAAYGWVFEHEFQWMAAKGYVVLYPNPRGSTTYGQDFGNIIQYKYPGDDFKDLMAGVDELIKRGYIDEKKLGVTGGSGGGVLTDWAVTHTDRFAAAVSQRDISNWESWWYTADFTLFQPTWFKAPPFQDRQDFQNRSAITYVEKIHTPMMFILGEQDYRTPPDSGGEQLFRALKFLKRPTVMVMFPRESHELSRSGEPWHRIERLEHIVGWFDKYLMGQSKPEYDVRPEKQVAAPPQQQQPQKQPPNAPGPEEKRP